MEPVTLDMILAELKKHDMRFDRIEASIGNISATTTNMGAKLTNLEATTTKMDARLINLEATMATQSDVAQLRVSIAEIKTELFEKFDKQEAHFNRRLSKLEGANA